VDRRGSYAPVRYTASVIERRLLDLGIVLPPVFPPAGNYLACVIIDDTVYVGGHGPIDGSNIIRGKLGSDLTLGEA
jgi:hypothetical protein